MTAQINDIFRLRDEVYSIAGISSGKLFHPNELGLESHACSTGCYRNYCASFGLLEGLLVLDELFVCLDGSGPILGVIAPGKPSEGYDFEFDNHYKELKYHLHFMGNLLLANGFIWELYVHSGFHPAWKYRRVIELSFEGGRLSNEVDRSQQMVEIRREVRAESNRWRLFPRKRGVGKDYNLPEGSYDRYYEL